MKKIIITIVVVVVLILAAYFVSQGGFNSNNYEKTGDDAGAMMDDSKNSDSDKDSDKIGEDMDDSEKTTEAKTVIGKTVDGNDITAYNYGNLNSDVETKILFVGGVHGGYSWNTALLAYQTMDYLAENPEEIPANIQVTVIPVLNPDGLNEITGTDGEFSASDVSGTEGEKVASRFNSNDVDLNRNFDCDWQSVSKWKTQDVSGGTAAFSEPEAVAFKNYVAANNPDLVIGWYSAAGGVFASACHDDVLAKTTEITKLYADASGYKAYEDFDFYTVTGDMMNWLAKENTPAISVLLSTHESTDWSQNLKGLKAILNKYAQ